MAASAPIVPGPDHPISIAAATRRVRVLWRGKIVAESRRALDLTETSYPVVKYIPRDDVDMGLLEQTPRTTYCPYKGRANSFSIRVGDAVATDAAWSYETPFPAVAAIAGHVAFYPDRVDRIEELDD